MPSLRRAVQLLTARIGACLRGVLQVTPFTTVIVEYVQDPHALEDLTGLTELHNSAAALMMDATEEEDDEDESLLRAPEAPADDWLEL